MNIFFFQAEDGIRDLYVTGVQTCALPISETIRASRITASASKGAAARAFSSIMRAISSGSSEPQLTPMRTGFSNRTRSEERRVGKGVGAVGRRITETDHYVTTCYQFNKTR